MGTGGYLATHLDLDMLRTRGIVISPESTLPELLPPVTNVVDQLDGRYLLHYIRAEQSEAYLKGRTDPCWVTPTAYSPEDAVFHLSLLAPTRLRTLVLLLDPTKLTEIRGPRLIGVGLGIEYWLPAGFSAGALIDNAATSDPRGAKWAVVVR